MVGITISGLRKRFGGTVAVDGVSLEVEKGELFFLLGPSGCGKTTILRIVAGLTEPDGGQVHFDQRLMNPVPPHRRNAGMVFQNYALWPHMNVAENVAYGLEERKVSRAEKERRVGVALRTVRMDEYAERMPNQLSGGQQQRVALARALVIEPDAVLLDEPLSNLDARLRLEMREEIRRIHDESGITMLYVTHDQKEALSLADRLAVMSMGRVEQVGDPRSVYRRPANRFVAEFIGETNLIPATCLSASDGYCKLKTPLGDFRVSSGDRAFEAGAAVLCMVRPECLTLSAEAENRFTATVKSSVYLGEVEQILLEGNGSELRYLRANPSLRPPSVGGQVELGFEADDAVVLSENQSGEGA